MPRPNPPPAVRGRADGGVDIVGRRRRNRKTRAAQNGCDRQLGPVVCGGAELVELGCPLSLGVGGDLVLKVGDRRDADQRLLVVKRDAVVAGQQAKARLGAGGDLRPVPLAKNRPGLDQVGVEEGRDGIHIGRDVEIGLVKQIVDGGLQFPRRRPWPALVAVCRAIPGTRERGATLPAAVRPWRRHGNREARCPGRFARSRPSATDWLERWGPLSPAAPATVSLNRRLAQSTRNRGRNHWRISSRKVAAGVQATALSSLDT